MNSTLKALFGKEQGEIYIRINNNISLLKHGFHNCKLVQHISELKDCNQEEHMLLQAIEQLNSAMTTRY